jgi:NADH-quinone oxidoreductase subunit J
MLPVIAFYLFSAVLIASALAVITARNPVHSVLFLILTFFNASGLFVLLGAEFVALILVIVYVGAVAVLFLFVVMMLDINFAELRAGMMKYLPLGVLTGGILLAELVTLARAWKVKAAPAVIGAATNTQALGMQLYTDYIYPFQISGLILLVAMIGAIVLTHRRRPDVRRQKIADQNARKPEDVMEVRPVTSGSGAA